MPADRRSPLLAARLVGGWAARALRRVAEPIEQRVFGRHGVELVPPRRLRARAGAAPAGAFLEGGRIAADELGEALESVGRTWSELDAVLDLGCGAGRVLPNVAARAPRARCFGCDVDPTAIRWLRRHRPQFDWRATRAEPPLPFEDECFDLVYSISVFSHLAEPGQDRWLAEVARVLRPGGAALLTVHGAYAFEQFRMAGLRTSWVPAAAFDRRELGPEEFVFEPYERSFWNRAELPGVAGAYGLAFHGHGYVEDHWSQWLEVVSVRERGISAWQDIVVARRSD